MKPLRPNPSQAAAEPRDGWVFYGLLALIAWAPLPLASNRTWAVGILLFGSLLLLTGAAWAWRGRLDVAFKRLGAFRWPLALLSLFVALVALQTLPLPSAWVATLSPEAHQVYAPLAEAGQSAWRLSVDPYQSRIFAVLSFVYLVVFGLTALLVRSSARVDLLAQFLVWSGVVEAVIGVVLYSAGAHYRLFFFDVNHDFVTGTFGNRNHLAGYLEMCLALGIGLMLARLGDDGRRAPNWKQRLVGILTFIISPKMRLRLLLVVMVIALVLTRSRMGNSAFFSAMLIAGLVSILLSRRASRSMVVLIASLVVIDVFLIGAWIGVEKVVQRLQGTTLVAEQESPGAPRQYREQSVEERIQPARYSLDLIQDFPVVGTGGGTFYGAFARYRPPEIWDYYDHAHNDYAEIAADTGAVGLALLGGVMLLAFGRALRVLQQRRLAMARGIAFGVLMAALAMAIHSTVDFNLQIPANALTFVVILALAWVAAELPSPRGRDHG